MKTSRLFSLVLCLTALLAIHRGQGQQSKTTLQVTQFLDMKAVPDGNFRVVLQIRGRERTLTFESRDNVARCIRSDDPRLEGLHGTFELIGNGVFLISLQNENYRATQYWLFREDGNAVVKEIPDRGEKQTAIRLTGERLDAPPK